MHVFGTASLVLASGGQALVRWYQWTAGVRNAGKCLKVMVEPEFSMNLAMLMSSMVFNKTR